MGVYQSSLLESREANILAALKHVLIEKLSKQYEGFPVGWFKPFLDKSYVAVRVEKVRGKVAKIIVVVSNSLQLQTEDEKNIKDFFKLAEWRRGLGKVLISWSGTEAENLYLEALTTHSQPYKSVLK